MHSSAASIEKEKRPCKVYVIEINNANRTDITNVKNVFIW